MIADTYYMYVPAGANIVKKTDQKEKEKAKDALPIDITLRKPQYFIVGGLVFVPLTEPYLKSEYGEEFDYRTPVRYLNFKF